MTRVELICSGTELLKDKLNTNGLLIAEQLSALGLGLTRVITVGDVSSDIEESLRASLKRSDIVFMSGGLGPTFDDLTRECVSKVLKKTLVFSAPILNQIKKRFSAYQKSMPKENERQAFLLRDATPILNRVGTAPGQIIRLGKKTLFLLPGPPKELRPMMSSAVLPFIKTNYPSIYSKSIVFHVFGYPESQIDEEITPIIKRYQKTDAASVVFGILAHRAMIDVKFSVTGKTLSQVHALTVKIRSDFYRQLGEKIFGENQDTMESVVGRLLLKQNLELSLAESCTGGLIAGKITAIPGSSEYFKEGLVTYSNESKMRLLGVRKKTLRMHGAVSGQTAEEMALGALKNSKSDWALSVTGIAGPGGAVKGKPVGTVCFGIASRKRVFSLAKHFFGDRALIRERAALTALDLLRNELLKT